MRVSNVLLVAALLVPAAGATQLTLRPGEYEVEMHMDFGMAGGDAAQKAVLDAAGFQNQKRRECLAAEDLKGTNLAKLFASEMEDENCKVSEPKTTGNLLTFTATCKEDGLTTNWSTEITFDPDSFSSVTKGKDSTGRVMGGKVTAKRVGECRK